MASPESDHCVDMPLMSPKTQRTLTWLCAGMSVLTAAVFALGFVAMQQSPPQPSLGRNVVVLALGIVMTGAFGWGAVAVRRIRAFLKGTMLYYSNGFRSTVRCSDLAAVKEARVLVKANAYVWEASLRLSGDGNLRDFPLAGSAVRLPIHSRELLAQALEQNPNAGAMNEVISVLRAES